MAHAGLGLRTTIVLTITVVMLITTLLVSFLVLTLAKKNLLEQKMNAGEILLNSLHHIISSSLTNSSDKGTSLQSTLANLYAHDSALTSLVFADTSLIIRAHKENAMIDQKSSDPDLHEAIYSGNIIKRFRIYDGKEQLVMSAPLYLNSALRGALQISLPLSDVEENMATFQQVVLLFTITTAFAFIMLGSLLLTRYLINPLEKLIKATEDITYGYFPQVLEPSGRNEIGTLSASLSRMSDKLSEDRKKIEQYIVSLEESNRELKKAQDEVMRSEKLASVGTLAAGVAHEIGNPIGIILGYLEILRQNSCQQKETGDILKRVENEIMRIDKIIRELLSFSHPGKTTLEPVQVNPIIEETLSLLSHQKAFNAIEVALKLEGSLPPVMADQQQFQQVVINILLNAMDAMPEGGELTVTTEQCNGIPHLSRTPSHSSGVRIIIRDTGIGIDKEHIDKIFDPFYTTKGAGKGTGLGLSVSVRIIESFGGTLSVESSPGTGTAFTIILPAHI